MPEIAQTADHALRILEELGNGEAMGAAQLAARLGLNRTVVQRLLATLRARGFVLRQGTAYRPGATLIRLAAALEPGLRSAAGPVMRALAEQTGETVVLHVVDGSDAVVLGQVVATGHVVQVSHQIGARHPLAVGASGRAMLAFLPTATTRQILSGNQQVAAVERALDGVRQARYSVSHDELQDGVHGVAVPLLDGRGDLLGSLAVLVPASRARGLETHVEALWAAAADTVHSYEAGHADAHTPRPHQAMLPSHVPGTDPR